MLLDAEKRKKEAEWLAVRLGYIGPTEGEFWEALGELLDRRAIEALAVAELKGKLKPE